MPRTFHSLRRAWLPRNPLYRVLAAGFLSLVLVAVLLACGGLPWSSNNPSQPDKQAAAPDPRLDYRGPYVNIHPDVRYVGDTACDSCHADKSRTYHHHPMGRSLAPLRDVIDQPPHDGTDGRFTAFDSLFQVERKGDLVVHRQTRLDEAGKPVYSLDLPVHYVIGSGTRGDSYLSDRDGFLFQTPMSWYSQKRVWDRSPNLSPAQLPGRPVSPECLFCHANRTHPARGLAKRLRCADLRWLRHRLRCCHGPGERHVQERRERPVSGGSVDPSIVNPAKLTPELRDAICEQCHLTGEPRLLRRGRGLYDFRPAMPLELFWSVFVQDRSRDSHHKAVNHVEQMHLSRCYQRGTGAKKLGCVSCHDPHEKPTAERRVEFYRGRCLECHREHGCTMPREARLRTSKEDSCIACHMPGYSASDIAHTAATDHRIVRRPTPPAGQCVEKRSRASPYLSTRVVPESMNRSESEIWGSPSLDSPPAVRGTCRSSAAALSNYWMRG